MSWWSAIHIPKVHVSPTLHEWFKPQLSLPTLFIVNIEESATSCLNFAKTHKYTLIAGSLVACGVISLYALSHIFREKKVHTPPVPPPIKQRASQQQANTLFDMVKKNSLSEIKFFCRTINLTQRQAEEAAQTAILHRMGQEKVAIVKFLMAQGAKESELKKYLPPLTSLIQDIVNPKGQPQEVFQNNFHLFLILIDMEYVKKDLKELRIDTLPVTTYIENHMVDCDLRNRMLSLLESVVETRSDDLCD